MGDLLNPGAASARRAARKQEKQIAIQKQKEDLRLAEETGEVERRKAFAQGSGGRQSLIATSAKGVTANLGGS